MPAWIKNTRLSYMSLTRNAFKIQRYIQVNCNRMKKGLSGLHSGKESYSDYINIKLYFRTKNITRYNIFWILLPPLQWYHQHCSRTTANALPALNGISKCLGAYYLLPKPFNNEWLCRWSSITVLLPAPVGTNFEV